MNNHYPIRFLSLDERPGRVAADVLASAMRAAHFSPAEGLPDPSPRPNWDRTDVECPECATA